MDWPEVVDAPAPIRPEAADLFPWAGMATRAVAARPSGGPRHASRRGDRTRPSGPRSPPTAPGPGSTSRRRPGVDRPRSGQTPQPRPTVTTWQPPAWCRCAAARCHRARELTPTLPQPRRCADPGCCATGHGRPTRPPRRHPLHVPTSCGPQRPPPPQTGCRAKPRRGAPLTMTNTRRDAPRPHHSPPGRLPCAHKARDPAGRA